MTLMTTKRWGLVCLAGLNLFLLIALLMSSESLPAALAQVGGRPGGDFTCATAKASGQSYETLYVLDITEDKLYAFYPSPTQRNQLAPTPPRDLRMDFNRK